MGRYLKRLCQVLVITFITLYCLIWLLSPLVIRSIVNHYGLPKPLSLTTTSSIRYNPFTAHLTISDLEIKANQQSSVLKLTSLEAEVHLHQLLFDKIHVAEFNLNGIFIPVTVNASSINVAGLELMAEQASPTSDKTEDSDQSSADFPYQVILPELRLNNAKIALSYFDAKHDIALDSLLLENILLSQNEQNFNLDLRSQFDGAPIEIALDGSLLKQKGKLDIAINAHNIALDSAEIFLPSSISSLDGQVSYTSNIALELADEHSSAQISNLRLLIEDLSIQQENANITVAKQEVKSDLLTILIEPNNALSVNSRLDYIASAILAKSPIDKAVLANISGLKVDNIMVGFDDNIAKINIDRTQVDKSQFSINQHLQMPALAAFNQLVIDNISYEPELVAVNSISVSGFVSHLLLNENKHLATLLSLSHSTENITETNNNNDNPDNVTEPHTSEPNNGVVDDETKSPKIAFKLGQFSFVDPAIINFKDASVIPHYERDLVINHLSLSNIDSKHPEQEMLFNMKAKSDKYAYLDIKGSGFPFASEQKFTLDAVVNEVSLPGVSSYIKDALKYEIESGQLDMTVQASLTGSALDGDVDLLLRGVEFTAADDHEAGSIVDQTSVPFNIALGMLKDSDGNVELSLPLTGDTSSPTFGFSGFLTLLVKQATMSAAKDYLITTFVPYAGVMKVAMAAGEFALKLRINDLNFAAGETELTDEQLEFSRQMSVMLADRGDVNVKLCAIATANDIGLEDISTIQQPDNIARLKALSRQRAENFKTHMVEQLDVPSARLLFCTPQIDSAKDAKARIKFVI